MIRSLPIALLLLASLLASPAHAAAPATTKPATPQASIRPETWQQDNERMRAQVQRLAARIAEMEERPAPATRPAPASGPTSRPVGLLIAENKRLVGSVNSMLERIAAKEDKPPLSKGVSDISITFACEGKTVEYISEFLGMTGQLASEETTARCATSGSSRSSRARRSRRSSRSSVTSSTARS